MRRALSKERFWWSALLMVAASAAVAQEPTQWLVRMNAALSSRNYDGTFSHWHGGRVEMLRIVHRVQDGAVTERLVSLDGSGREFIRKGAELSCYLPDKRTVLVEHRAEDRSLLGSWSFPVVDARTASYYDIREVARVRFNRQDTRLITVSPRDEFRYGYRLWIDESTAMPLKTQLCDGHGRVIEQMVFASLKLPSHIPDSDFNPDLSTAGFQWLRNDSAPRPAPADAHIAWNALQLPPGFRIAVRSAQSMPGSSDPVSHLVFTDGLASVSVFVENRQTRSQDGETITEESARLGSSSVFSTTMNGRKVTAVGEVPPATVRSIASSFALPEAASTPASR